MIQRKTLRPNEIRVIKLERKAILELLWEILSGISQEILWLPCNKEQHKSICIEGFFVEEQCEYVLLAHNQNHKLNAEAVVQYINTSSLVPVESTFVTTKNGLYDSIYDAGFCASHPTSVATAENFRQNNAVKKLLRKLGVRVRALRKNEIRVILLSKGAILELLWEHFMETGNEAMEIPQEETDDFETIYHMYTGENLEELTLYVMNLAEASENTFMKISEYCDQNVRVTTDSYLKTPICEQKYVSVYPMGHSTEDSTKPLKK